MNTTLISQMYFSLLPAQILSTATSSLSGIINGLIIGNYMPAAAMVALGFVTPINAILGAIATVVYAGARILCGRSIGRGDIKSLDKIFTNALIILIVVGLILTFFGLSCSEFIASLVGAKGNTNAATAEYIRGISIGIIPLLMVPCFMVFLQIRNRSNYAFASSIVLAASNLIGALINVKLLSATVFGMGLVSSISQLIALIFLAVPFFGKNAPMHFDRKTLDAKLWGTLTAIGSSAALAALLYALRNVCINSLALEVGGETAVNAVAIVFSAMGTFDAVNIGIVATMGILYSVFVGEQDEAAMRSMTKFSLKIGFIILAVKTALLMVFAAPLCSLFGASAEVMPVAVNLVRWYAVSGAVNIFTCVVFAVFQGLGRVVVTNISYVFNAFAFPVVWSYISVGFMGLAGIWSCYTVAEILSMAVFVIIAMVKTGHFPKSFFDIFYIPDDFLKGERLNISLTTMDEVINVSEKIVDFCKKNGIDERRSMISGLCIEEMAGNIIEHGFTKGKNRHYSVDIFACCADGTLSLRIRNNTPEFDPLERLNTYTPEDPTKNIGIHMISKLAKNMNYQQSFGMNVLNIEI